jgi:acetoin utilization deacetylase AcuC-like enzyme
MKAVDLIVGGQCVNVFCATRPPGHHAGRDLHPMGAVSNGFCVLNPVACAAIYATTPPSEGGLGLKRAVVIDFDVHHGNGTQDILCSTYDPRFLYISMHAGGAQINGYETEDSDMDFPSGRSKKQEGIFPGRCGDTSPHKGVLNLPLGARVTPHDVGNALVTLIEPAVEVFSPDIIILSAGFDGHKNDPLGMGGLAANDFGHITEVACAMAFRYCSGRIMSVLEGGYGVPCCRPQKDLFLPPAQVSDKQNDTTVSHQNQPIEAPLSIGGDTSEPAVSKRPQPSKLMDLGEVLPDEMDDQVTPGLQRKLEKCHAEGFIDCVREHVISLKTNNSRA